MKGGSVKGLAYVGALKELEKYYHFNWYIGTSAGAIAAVLLAAGYTADELEEVLSNKNFRDFLDARFYQWPFNLLHYKGIFPADTLQNWMNKLLAEKLEKATQVRLEHLPHRVTVYASRRDEDTLRFDRDDPETKRDFAAFAVRCSLTIPFVFIPQTVQGKRVLDGGMRNNYPIKALLTSHPDTKFIGLYLGARIYEGNAKKERTGLLSRELISIWTEASDSKALEEYAAQTIIIDPRRITTLSFNLTSEEKAFLISAGRAAALDFVARNMPTSGVTKEEAIRAQDQVEQQRVVLQSKRRAKRRRIATLAIVLFLLLTGGVYALTRYALTPVLTVVPNRTKPAIEPPARKLISIDTRVNLYNLSDWTAPSAEWVIDRDSSNNPTGKVLVKETEQLAYSKSLYLRSFSATFNLVLENNAGAAWGLRVKDESNYYLFYLSGPDGANPNNFCAFVVRDGKVDLETPLNPTFVSLPLTSGAQYVVKISVNDGVITHTLNPSNSDPLTKGRDFPIHEFPEADSEFHYGSIGFRTIKSEKFSIGNLVVRPINAN